MLVGSLVAGYLIFVLALLAGAILVMVFYLLTLQRALEKCSPYNRTMTPGHVWLQIIPLFGFVWQFFVVGALSSSLKREYDSRRMAIEPQPGRSLGIAMCVCVLLTWIPYVGWIVGVAHLVLWIIYWVKISNYSRALDIAPRYAAGPGGPPAGPYYGSPTYGAPQYASQPPYPGQPSYGAQPYSPPTQVAPVSGAPLAGYQAPSYLQPQESAPEPAQSSPAGWLSASARTATQTCTACGVALVAGSAFCGSCGTKAE
jgi:hypothetical protein